MRITDALDERGVTFDEQQRVLGIDVGDEEGGEGQAFLVAQFAEGGGNGFRVVPEISKAELLDL